LLAPLRGHHRSHPSGRGSNVLVPSLDAILIEEHDQNVNALGIKGVGEIGITGSAGAVANSVWHTREYARGNLRSRWIASSRLNSQTQSPARRVIR